VFARLDPPGCGKLAGVRSFGAIPVLFLLAGCSATSPGAAPARAERLSGGKLTLVPGPGVTEADMREITPRIERGMDRVASFFGAPFRSPFAVHLFRARSDLDDFWRRAWNEPSFTSECWMVGSGTERRFVLLVPAAWAREACDHDPDDEVHVQNLITHELVHVYHDQHNPAESFDGLEPLSWYVEGLATYVSGQLDERGRLTALDAIRASAAPTSLERAWQGKYRYGVCGSLVKYLDARGGRSLLTRLLRVTTPAEVHEATGMDEAQLLTGWRAWAE
jgi:hypothetical protein